MLVEGVDGGVSVGEGGLEARATSTRGRDAARVASVWFLMCVLVVVM